MNARLLSNMTVAPLVPLLRPWTISLGEYTSLLDELLDQNSVAAGPGVTHVFCLFDSDSLLGPLTNDDERSSRAVLYVEALERFCRTHPDKTIVSHTFVCSSNRVANFSELFALRSARASEAALNNRLLEVARNNNNLLLIDLEPIFRRFGEEQLVTSAFWYSGRIRYTPLMFRQLSTTLYQALSAYEGRSKKVLVLDLDNTLWGGIVGDVGPDAIELSEDGVGAIFRDFQRAVKDLKEMGVLLAICSKNNAADIDEIFSTNRMMLLQVDDFAAIRINWENKAENIIDIAESLQLGLDSFVFVDDNPVERSIVSSALPSVTVPDFPSRIDTLPRWFVTDVIRPHFGRYRITDEDVNKTEQYAASQRRQSFAANFDFAQFINQLNIVMTVYLDDPKTIVRASQMTQKTNQANLTTLRCDIPEITRYVTSREHALIVIDYADRFGSEGQVALAMLDLTQRRITNFLMSCRVIGRNVEVRLMDAVLEVARRHNLASIAGKFIPTSKNSQVATLYERLGFRLIDETVDGSKTYEKQLA